MGRATAKEKAKGAARVLSKAATIDDCGEVGDKLVDDALWVPAPTVKTVAEEAGLDVVAVSSRYWCTAC